MPENEPVERMRKLIAGIRNLPTLPAVIAKLTKLLADPDTSVKQVTGLLAEDQALTAKLLKLANSSYYGFAGQIASVGQAVVMLGFGGVRDVALSASVIELFRGGQGAPDTTEDLFPVAGFWEHSIGVGVACRMLARQRKLGDPEEAFVAGLLHDIGKLVLLSHAPGELLAILRDCRQSSLTFVEAEARRGTDHAALGRMLVEYWKLPERIGDPVGFHHSVRPRRPTAGITAAVQFADVLVRARGVGCGGDDFLPALQPDAMQLLRLDGLDLDAFVAAFDEEMLKASVFVDLAAGAAPSAGATRA